MPIAAIASRFKGTHDIAGVAEAIRDSGLRSEFEWSEGESGVDSFDFKNVGQLYEARKMNCYEFVHFCAFLCGLQTTVGLGHQYGVGKPKFNPTDTNILRNPVVTIAGPAIDQVSSITRGALVAGVKASPKDNNMGGFFHIGIATKATEVIHLINAGWIGTDNLKSAPLSDWFASKDYTKLLLTQFNWKSAFGDPYTAPLPTFGLAGNGGGVAAVGSPSGGVAAAGSPSSSGR